MYGIIFAGRTMMKENDVQLIHRVLSGDDEAFNVLVEKYRRNVHALAWRKVGDFHFAEEITQDVFLQSIQKTHNTQESQSLCWVALCHYKSTLQELASKKQICGNTIIGKHK